MSETHSDRSELLIDGAMQVAEAVTWSGIGRSRLYVAMNCGALPFLKVGSRRLIPKAGLRDYLALHVAGED